LLPVAAWSFALIYSIGQLVAFAFEPMEASLAPREHPSPLAVEPYVTFMLLMAGGILTLFAYADAHPGFPEKRAVVGFIGSMMLGLSVWPPQWLRQWLEVAPGIFGPVGSRILSGAIGLLCLLASLMNASFIGQ
jgi:hypothetical protein